MLKARRHFSLIAVSAVGLIALAQYWLGPRRPSSFASQKKSAFVVYSPADRGPGTLREAIFDADATPDAAEIHVRVNQISLDGPLPPLLNPKGIKIVADRQGARVTIDSHNAGQSPVLEISSPHSVIAGIEIAKAMTQAILVKTDGVRISNTSFVNCDEGIHATAEVTDLEIKDGSFRDNRIGIWLGAPGSRIQVEGNSFANSDQAAIWAVNAKVSGVSDFGSAEIRNNTFQNDRTSLVLANFPATAEGNEFIQARETAVYLFGQNIVIRNNRIRNGAIGVSASATQNAVIQSNEIDHNRVLAIIVCYSGNTLVDNNRVYSNSYGIALVKGEPRTPNIISGNTVIAQRYDGITVIGESPFVRGNTATNNGTGLRIMNLVAFPKERIVSEPLLDHNLLAENATDQPVRSDYRAENRP